MGNSSQQSVDVIILLCVHKRLVDVFPRLDAVHQFGTIDFMGWFYQTLYAKQNDNGARNLVIKIAIPFHQQSNNRTMHSILVYFVYHLHTIPIPSFLIKLAKKSSSFAYVCIP